MIVIPDARLADLYAQWSRVGAHTAPAEAEPLVLDCVRRLAAEPGGESVHVWVAGLAEMVRYLAWRPRPETARAAVAALVAAASALDATDCGHQAHPYEEELEHLSEDSWGSVGACASYLIGEHPEHPRPDDASCPRNVAGIARVTADVIAPFSASGIPEAVPQEHAQSVRDLKEILNDHPIIEPAPEIESNTGYLSDRPTRGALAGYILTQHVTAPYAVHRITLRPVFDAMIEGLERALGLLGDAGGCAHADGEHPDEDDLYYESVAEIGFHVRSPGGRAELTGWLDEPADAWVCPDYLRSLAEDALGSLRSAHEELFAVRDTSGLDAAFVRPDGHLDIGALTQTFVDADDLDASGVAGHNAGLWAARRHAEATDPHERLVLLHLALWAASVFDLPYGVGREVRALLRGVDPEPLDHDCPHGDAHPDAELRESGYLRTAFKAHLDHLYAPAEFAAPEGAYPVDVWACANLLADWARDPIVAMDERYEEMDEEDDDDGSIFC
ncbi:hypothetical protein PV721_15315 [Streptomyces sp. MB09-01]|uniref:hypothetical protein n=1 Tax=Streptomyces sp. MB09-01 TaxID=3028666 RepID=UPI0029ABC780|nr:hypothetical protein [Streptomyces sp. MB09-01]MDX3535705.1 hypothetical protein [Streptomyces sp. MB09-01]